MHSEVDLNSLSATCVWGKHLQWHVLSKLGCKLTGYGRLSTLSKIAEETGHTQGLTIAQFAI